MLFIFVVRHSTLLIQPGRKAQRGERLFTIFGNTTVHFMHDSWQAIRLVWDLICASTIRKSHLYTANSVDQPTFSNNTASDAESSPTDNSNVYGELNVTPVPAPSSTAGILTLVAVIGGFKLKRQLK